MKKMTLELLSDGVQIVVAPDDMQSPQANAEALIWLIWSCVTGTTFNSFCDTLKLDNVMVRDKINAVVKEWKKAGKVPGTVFDFAFVQDAKKSKNNYT